MLTELRLLIREAVPSKKLKPTPPPGQPPGPCPLLLPWGLTQWGLPKEGSGPEQLPCDF